MVVLSIAFIVAACIALRLVRERPEDLGQVADDLFARGLCLPSGSSLSEANVDRVIAVVRSLHRC